MSNIIKHHIPVLVDKAFKKTILIIDIFIKILLINFLF